MAPEAGLRTELDKVVLDTLRPLTVVLGPFLLWTAYADRSAYSGALASLPMWADIGAGTFLLASGALAYAWRPRPAWAHPWGLMVIASLCMTSGVALVVRGVPATVPTLVLVALGAGIVMLSFRWLAAAIGLVAATWIAGTWGMPNAVVDPPQFLLQIGGILGLVVGWARIRAYRSIIHARQEAEQANQKIRTLNEELERFAAVVTHDLQTPLSALRLKAQIARAAVNKNDDGRVLDALGDIDRIAGESGVFVHEMLEYARSGQGLMHTEHVNMNDMLAHVHKLVESRLMSNHGQLDWDELPTIHGDPVLLRQLVLNLVSNSLRYQSPERPLRMHIAGFADAGGVSISFADNGIGLDTATADRLFEPFELGSDSEAGHGLGLATCKRIVDAHGGNISVEGAPGQGATFIVELPVSSEQPVPELSPS